MFSQLRTVLIIFISILWIHGCVSSDKPVTIIHNVNGYTMTDAGDLHQFDALAFTDDVILKTGTFEALASEYDRAEKINGDGKTLLPGLIDSHGHIIGLGESLLRVNQVGAESLEEAVERVGDYAGRYPDLAWIQGRGWNQTHWTVNEFPTAADLNQVVSDRPVYLRRVDGHAAWVNTKALEIAGIDADTPDPQGGAILKDKNGNPTGVLIDRAMYLVQQHIPDPDEQESRSALDLALEQMAKHGLTGVHDAGVSVRAFNLYREYAEAGKLTSRIYGLISGAGETFDTLSENGLFERDDKMLALKSVKLYSDGALGSRGAALKEDYSDDPGNRGLLFESDEEFYNQISKVVSKGYQAGVHAIGDRANHVILNAFERVKDELGDSGLRHRIEHAQIVSTDEIPRFAEIGIIASMQPTHATSDMNMAEDRVGPDRIKGGYAWQRFLDAGVRIAAGSDFPVEDVNPFYGLYSAVTRADHDGNPEGGWYADQALSREVALRVFTLDAAYAGHAENELGSLEPDKKADFILIDRDYFTVDASEIWQIQVEQTWVNGKRVY